MPSLSLPWSVPAVVAAPRCVALVLWTCTSHPRGAAVVGVVPCGSRDSSPLEMGLTLCRGPWGHVRSWQSDPVGRGEITPEAVACCVPASLCSPVGARSCWG